VNGRFVLLGSECFGCQASAVDLNDTADFYRYFDATLHAEFLYSCIERTIEFDLPQEARFLVSHDRFRRRLGEIVDMPERTAELLFRFLRQNDGKLSQRAREREFASFNGGDTR
jgi:hypothetical protein